MKPSSLFLIALSLVLLSFRSDKPAYLLYDREGKAAGYQEMIEIISSADVVFFGELHDNPISHWLEYEVAADLFRRAGDGLILGAEMFEADDQLVLDEYLSGRYEADKFEAEVKLWKNYRTDYKPLVEFARKKGLQDGDLVWVESYVKEPWAKVQGEVFTSEGIHPESCVIGGQWGRWAVNMNPIAKEGPHHNSLLSIDLSYVDHFGGNIEMGSKVKVYKV